MMSLSKKDIQNWGNLRYNPYVEDYFAKEVVNMRNYKEEFEKRVEFIRNELKKSGCTGTIFGNSGGKDCALVGILCKAACDDTVGVIMPCASSRNFGSDKDDGEAVADKFNIETRIVDLTAVREKEIEVLSAVTTLNNAAISNLAPRLRMTTLYGIAAAENRLVVGTGNACEIYMGYFTKWGDGGHDINPISDLTVSEVYEFLEYLDAPRSIIEKAPSAGLFEGQTDEQEMGVTYAAIERYIKTGEATEHDKEIIDRYHARSEHKRGGITKYKGE